MRVQILSLRRLVSLPNSAFCERDRITKSGIRRNNVRRCHQLVLAGLFLLLCGGARDTLARPWHFVLLHACACPLACLSARPPVLRHICTQTHTYTCTRTRTHSYFTFKRNLVDTIVIAWLIAISLTTMYTDNPMVILRLQSLGLLRLIRLQPLYKYIPGYERLAMKIDQVSFTPHSEQFAASCLFTLQELQILGAKDM